MGVRVMAKELKNIGEEYRKASQDSFASVVRSVGEIHRSFQGIASEMIEQSKRSVGQALELQVRIAKKAYDIYVSELTKLGQMIFSGYPGFLNRTEEGPTRRIIGSVSADGAVQVNGQIDGDLNCTSITVSPNALISGAIKARSVVVNGKVEGPISGEEVALKPHAFVTGDIQAQSLSIERGAILRVDRCAPM